MTYKISEDRRTLTLIADEEERENLRELKEDQDWGCSKMEAEALEDLLGNSELNWVNPADTGDLTEAPLLGIIGWDQESRENSGPHGFLLSGGDKFGARYVPILERWGYMQYATRSFLDDLVEYGQAVFVDRN